MRQFVVLLEGPSQRSALSVINRLIDRWTHWCDSVAVPFNKLTGLYVRLTIGIGELECSLHFAYLILAP